MSIEQGDLSGGATAFIKDTFEYDELGQTHRTSRSIQVPNQGTQVYNTYSFYDSFGRVLRLKYPDNEQVDYQYTPYGSLESIITQMPSQPKLDIITNITYDGYDNISYILYGNETETEYNYHGLTRALESTSTNARALSGGTVYKVNERQFTYNEVGLITDVDMFVDQNVVPQQNSFGWSSYHHTYDDASRLVRSDFFEGNSSSFSHRVTTTFNTSGAITSKNSVVAQGNWDIVTNNALNYNSSYTYNSDPTTNAHHQLTEVKDQNGNFWYNFTYNDQGSITERTHKDAAGTALPNEVEQFVWNDDQQLAAVRNKDVIQHYAYDYTGTRVLKTNLTSSSVVVDDNLVSNSGTIAADPYTLYVNEYFVASMGDNFEQVTKHYYMGMQRVASDLSLQEVPTGEEPGGEEPGGGEPLKTNSTSTTNTSSTDVVLNDLQTRLGELGYVDGTDYNSQTLFENQTLESMYPEYVEEYNEANSSNKTNYSDPANECCFFGERYWYHPDYLGSVAVVTNDEGVVHQMFFTNAWGEKFSTYDNPLTGSFNSPYRFNGKELDEETGLAYYGARYYDNKLSMWLSVDPLAMEGHNIFLSPYHSSSNNPVMRVDPDGMFDSPIFDYDGYFLGFDSEGYSGQVRVMDKTRYAQLTNNCTTEMSHQVAVQNSVELVRKEGEQTVTDEAHTRILHHVLSEYTMPNGTRLSSSNFRVASRGPKDLDRNALYEGQTNGQHFTTDWGFAEKEYTVENIWGTFGLHEIYLHGVLGLAQGALANQGSEDFHREHLEMYMMQLELNPEGVSDNYLRENYYHIITLYYHVHGETAPYHYYEKYWEHGGENWRDD